MSNWITQLRVCNARHLLGHFSDEEFAFELTKIIPFESKVSTAENWDLPRHKPETYRKLKKTYDHMDEYPRNYLSWSLIEDTLVKSLYNEGHRPLCISKELERTPLAIQSRITKLGLRNKEETLSEE